MEELPQPPKSTAFVNWLKKDIRNGNTPIVVVCGRQRSGKTAFAMRTAWEVFPDKFKYENVVDSIETFALAMKKNRHNIIILDEASASLFVYDWNSYLHRVFSIIQDSQAYRHNVVMLVLPRVTKLDNLTKFDIDAIVEMKKVKFFDIVEQKKSVKYAYKFLIHHKQYSSFRVRNPIVEMIGEFVGVPLPPDYLWLPYISKDQQQFKEKLLDEQLDLISRKQNNIKPLKPNVVMQLV